MRHVCGVDETERLVSHKPPLRGEGGEGGHYTFGRLRIPVAHGIDCHDSLAMHSVPWCTSVAGQPTLSTGRIVPVTYLGIETTGGTNHVVG